MTEHNGFLTATDRKFLRGGKEYDTKQGRYDRRRAIRERTQQAFRDFIVLYEEMNEDERRKIFDVIADGTYHPNLAGHTDEEPPDEIRDAQEFQSGLFSTLAFMYLGLWGTSVSFDNLVEAAVFQSERDRLGRLVEVSLKIEEQEPMYAVESAINKLEAGDTDDLDHTEMRLLIEFLSDPTEFRPESERQQALERLNDIEQFPVHFGE
jgi:hypothetical protein